ncbi:hypothetical protein Cni_G09453 [Canna indica]|uniref:Uncharacterized protein n=1 Tax=Canna indica TaxID=4628 RepID=A0AAQ3K4C2_9LILI|nr:hypothetical protein Cni_G09453 [Canna indica]
MRNRHNKIWRLDNGNGGWCTTSESIELKAQDLFSSSSPLDPTSQFEHMRLKVTNTMNINLTQPIFEGEVKFIVFSLDSCAAPSDNGFTAKFYQCYWEIVGKDVCKAIQNLFSGGRMLKSFNHTHICLIPNVKNATSMAQANESYWRNLIDILHTYEQFSGQRVNLNKSLVFFSRNTSRPIREYLATLLQVPNVGA